MTRYFRMTNYMWMFCEGYYLHKLIASAFAEENSLLPLYIIGWGNGFYLLIRTRSCIIRSLKQFFILCFDPYSSNSAEHYIYIYSRNKRTYSGNYWCTDDVFLSQRHLENNGTPEEDWCPKVTSVKDQTTLRLHAQF